MIRVRRPPTPPPSLVEAAAKELEEYRLFLKPRGKRPTRGKVPAKKSKSAQHPAEGFKFKAYRLKAVKTVLEATFHFKCAYCESEYSVASNVRIEHFRPKGRVDREGMQPIGGYYWLAAEWSNLLPSCERCNSPKKDFIPSLNREETVGKSNWFPLWDETKRAAKRGEEKTEYPLLLDPCKEDPEQYLTFDENGGVEPVASLSPRRMAKAEKSIRLYGLGRLRLVKDRHEYAKRVLGQIERVTENYENWRKARRDPERLRRLLREWDDLEKFLTPDAPYLCMAKQMITHRLNKPMKETITRLLSARR